MKSRILRNRVILGKRVVLRHLAELDITSSSDPDGILSVHTSGVYMMIFYERVVYPAFLLTLPWPR